MLGIGVLESSAEDPGKSVWRSCWCCELGYVGADFGRRLRKVFRGDVGPRLWLPVGHGNVSFSCTRRDRVETAVDGAMDDWPSSLL